MADAFFDSEASVSEDEEFKASSDEEEEEEEGEDLDKNLDDLIDDNPVEEEESESSDSGAEGGKRKRKSDSEEDDDDRLEEDDYDLIEENLGVKVARKKFRRLRQVSSDEESEDEGKEEEPRIRDAIANQLFEGDDDEDSILASARQEPPPPPVDERQYGEILASEEESESDPDDFIVDDEGLPIKKKKDRRKLKYSDAALQEAQDIFGIDDFDLAEFEHYGEDFEDEEEEYEDEDEYNEEEAAEEGGGVVIEGGEEALRPRKKAPKKKTSQLKKNIFEVFEPSELERGHFTSRDNEIKTEDVPERFQLRRLKVEPAKDAELEEEAEWIYRHTFMTLPVSMQDLADPLTSDTVQYGSSLSSISRRNPSSVGKIREALNFMRNQQHEVPFIAFYRKEYVEPELNIYDLWKVYYADEKWCQLQTRKQNLKQLFQKMQSYQFQQISENPDEPLQDKIRPLTESDLDKLNSVETVEELKDVYTHFLLYYGRDLPKMQNSQKNIKQATRKGMYAICEQAGIDGFAKKYGLTPEQFGENLRDNYQRHETEQYPVEPLEAAKDFVCSQFASPEAVLEGACYIVALQLAHDPLVRQCVRQTYYERAKLSVTPTKKGIQEIDENHNCYPCKYLKDKPAKELVGDQFLRLHQAQQEKLLTLHFTVDMAGGGGATGGGLPTYLDEVRQLYYRDEFSQLVQEWNKERQRALQLALQRVLYPALAKELHSKLLQEAHEAVVKVCCRKMFNWLKYAPYQVDQPAEAEDEYLDGPGRIGLKVLALASISDKEVPSFGAMLDGDGEVMDFIRLPGIMLRSNSYVQVEKEKKAADMANLKKFILEKKPHVIAVSTESRDTLTLVEDIKQCLAELEAEEQLSPIGVELVDNNMAIIYQNSKQSEQDFREYPALLRRAISLGRRLQDPLMEFSRLFSTEEEVLCLKMHPLQELVSKEDLLEQLSLEFVYRVNEVGADINQAINHVHAQYLVQFICGLGPRKGMNLLRTLKMKNMRLENRTQLVTACHMGPKVFINCAGFIRIDTTAMGDSTDSYIEVLDGSRVHPETYEWARKMAVDALEYDESAEDANPAGALEEILENPDKLKDLDLDAFAQELERQGYGNKSITLYDIRAELNSKYKDLRVPHQPLSTQERFYLLTGETAETLYAGRLVLARVTGIAYKRPRGDQLEEANPNRNEETGLWQCPFCQQDNFPQISAVWNHFDGNNCPGQSIGVRVRLDNGLTGFIPTKLISDKEVKKPEERVKTGMMLHARVTKMDIDRFQVDLSTRSSDLRDLNNELRPSRDLYFDYDAYEQHKKKDEEKKKKQQRATYVKRVIVHPSFHNIGYKETEKLMANMDQGEVIVRPSSKGEDHLTVTWKVDEGIYQHIDVREQGKENAFSLGHSLWIGDEEFEDLDEIIARHVQPMASFARDLVQHKYYVGAEGGKREALEALLQARKKKAPSQIPYQLSLSHQLPGKCLLSYQPRLKARHEYITLTPDGYRYRQQLHHSVNSTLKWFKDHFRDPVPGVTPGTRHSTPMSARGTGTPAGFNLANVDTSLLHKAISAFPSSAQGFGTATPRQTPQLTTPQLTTPYYRTGMPFTTPQNAMATPMMTPSYGLVTPQATPGIRTPQLNPMRTPQVNPLRTPQVGGAGPIRTPQINPATGVRTPQVNPGGIRTTPQVNAARTPQYLAGGTPRQSWGGGGTPRQHHPTATTSAKATTPQRPAARRQQQHHGGGSADMTDWAKAAQQWAKQKGTTAKGSTTPSLTTPSPMIEGTPAGGDATPLIDET